MTRFAKERTLLKTDFEILKGIKTGAAKGEVQPPIEKPIFDHQEVISLPTIDKDILVKANVYDCIKDRHSVRTFSNDTLNLDELAYLLWSTQGVRCINDKGKYMRTVPSAGMTHTLETYLMVRNVVGLKPGIYRYQVTKHALIFIKAIDNIEALIDEMTMAERQPFMPYFAGKANVIFVWTTIPYRSEWKFDIQAHKKILIDVGHVCQNLYIAGESIDTGVCAIGIYNQDKMDQLLEIDGDEEITLYLAAVGKK